MMKTSKRLIKFILFLGVVALVAFLGYRYWTRTPQYSLLQIQKAVSARNVDAFEKYVDVDSTVNSFVDDLVDVSMATHDALNPQNRLNPLDTLSKQFARGIVSTIKPALALAAKHSLRYYIRNGKVEEEKSSQAMSSPAFDFGKAVRENSAKFDGFDYVKTQNNTAHVGLRMKSEKPGATPFIVEIEMQWMNGYWQVKRWSNAPAVFQQLGNIALSAPFSGTRDEAKTPPDTSTLTTSDTTTQTEAYRVFVRKAVQELDTVAQDLKNSYSSGMPAYADAARTGRAKMQALTAELSALPIPSHLTQSSVIMAEGINDTETGLIHWVEYTKSQTEFDQKEAMEKMDTGNALMVRAATMAE